LAKNQILTWLNGAWQTLKPSVGQRVFLQDTPETIVFNDGQWMLAQPIYSSAQLCSNEAFQIWQRGQSFVGPGKSGNLEFVADLWFSVNSGSQSIIVKAQFEDKNWLRVERPAGSSFSQTYMIAQILVKKPSMPVLQVTFRIRRGIDFSGGPIIAEVLASSAPDATSVQLSQNAWLGQTEAGSKTFSLSQSALEQVISFNGELPASAKSTAFRLRWTSAGVTGSADTLDIREVKIVSASVPTPFVPPDFRETLAHCELYFEKS